MGSEQSAFDRRTRLIPLSGSQTVHVSARDISLVHVSGLLLSTRCNRCKTPGVIQVNPIDPLQVISRRPKSTQDTPSRPKSTQVDPSRPKSTQDTPSQPKSTQVDPSQPESTQVNPSDQSKPTDDDGHNDDEPAMTIPRIFSKNSRAY
ncbi:hypothetical protein DPMN_189039 [Dreissena polymorpha]|uniref:Uncharacterized protein n=1 Tax=Dreissena polymorpha TaxID=45954 RepID=A0A9D4DS14_DREPO|nr:hypothetical protein DPMN_189039 [Dreissena polymorpha]